MQIVQAEKHALLKRYPVLCGLFLYAIKIRFQEVSIAFANAWGSILFTSHLYNAVHQEKFLSKAWRDVEMLIALQSTETMFTGDLPHGHDAYFKRFLLCMGYSSTNFASNRRNQNTSSVSVRGPKSLSELSPVAKLLSDRYCENASRQNWTMDALKVLSMPKKTGTVRLTRLNLIQAKQRGQLLLGAQKSREAAL